MTTHARVSVSGLCFPTFSAVETLEAVAGLGVTNASLTAQKIREAGAHRVAEASARLGVAVVTTTGALGLDLRPGADLAEQLLRAEEDVDNAAIVGARAVYGLTGPRSVPDWDLSAAAYADALAPLVAHATSLGVRLSVEPASWLYADLSFVHTLHDALRLGRAAGTSVCLDLFHTWTEGTLRDDLLAHVGAVAHVQLSDMVLGDRSLPCRAVPGEGGVPLAAVVGWLVDAGYEGVFDLELSGPRIDAIGHHEAARRAVAWLDELLGGHDDAVG